ncbi:rhomboid family intramembrane serine protease [Novispirillum sp. DQ9]|uniref:rhomboid family intramembrane serine protease n=1 Tax=Novispirillum sp. DQ9 TaxID=3398612 RepID=UPI003C7B6FDA
MIPLHDDNPTTLRPVVTITLIVLCIVVFLWQVSLPERAAFAATIGYGAIPAVLFGQAHLPPALEAVPPFATLLTSMFLHGGWLHIIGNMLYLWTFGNNVEDSMGHGRFVLFYLLCGIAAALAHAVQDIQSTVPMIGASGAISGVLGAYLLLYPRARILVLVWLGLFVTTVKVPAMVVLGFWILLQLVNLGIAAASEDSGGVAWMAHLGGFVAGMVLLPVFKKRHIPLFRSRSGPWG